MQLRESIGLIELDAAPSEMLMGGPLVGRFSGSAAIGERLAPVSCSLIADLDSLRAELLREFDRVVVALGRGV